MKPRGLFLGAGAASIVLAVGGSAVALRADSDSDGGASDSGGTAPGTATATVTRRDLEERAELDGTLGYGEARQVSLASGGTITALPALGTVVDRGQTLVEVDGRAVPLLFGDRPLWRPLGPDVTDGQDVEQLEANLVALGIVTADELTVDQEWTAATTSALAEWQRALGRDDSGVLAPGEAVVLPAAVRISGHPTPVGGQAGGNVAEVTGATRQVTLDLDASNQGLVAVDQPVEVVLPDGTTVPGGITQVGRVAESDDGDEESVPGAPTAAPTIEVTVALDDPDAGGSLDQAPVSVRVVTSTAQDVLAVPVDALLALAEGGFAVERVGAGGADGSGGSGSATELVAVDAGAFADGWVEVTGAVAEGDEVVVPE